MELSKMATSNISKIKKTFKRKPYLLNTHQCNLLFAFRGIESEKAEVENVTAAKSTISKKIREYTQDDLGQEATNIVKFDYQCAINYPIVNLRDIIQGTLEEFNDGIHTRWENAVMCNITDFDILRLTILYSKLEALQKLYRKVYTSRCRLHDVESPIYYSGSAAEAQSIINRNTHVLRDLVSIINSFYGK